MLTVRHHRMTVPAHSVTSDRWRDFDPMMFISILVLIGFGLVSIWSAVGLPPLTSNNEASRQALFGLIGVVMMLVVASIDYRFLVSLAWPLYLIGVFFLVLVQTPLGATVNNAQNWFVVGPVLVQPSEFAKISTIIALSAFIASRGSAMKEFGNFVIAGLIVALPAGLILIGPDLGQAMVYVALWGASLLIARTRNLYLAALVILLPIAAWAAWEFVLLDYHRDRVLVSFNPESDPLGGGYQIIQARISIGAGGMFGAGITGGTQSTLELLGVRESDFIFAHASGMFGFLGMVGLFIAQIILLWRCLKVAEVARDIFGQCLAICITGVLFFQAFLNIGMNVGLMPVAGITLPFVSYGPSSLWTFLILAGVLQSIRLHHRKLAFERR